MVKSLPVMQETWVRKIPWRREWLPILVFLPGEFHGQRSLAGYSPWGCKVLDMTERLYFTLYINNLRYADDITLMAESEEELKSLLMKVKEESENVA